MRRMSYCCAALGLLLPAMLWGEEPWNRFRGPNGSGVVRTDQIPTQWNADDFNWRVELPGQGHSCPVLWEDRLFVTSGNDQSGERIVLCFDADSGKQLWSKSFPAVSHGKHALNSFASATPAVDAKRIYVCWATPDQFAVVALSHQGQLQWQTDLGGFKAGHGFGTSPIVYGELLVVPNEQEGDSTLVALDVSTGKIQWKVPRSSKVTYSTPCVLSQPDEPDSLIFTNWQHGITAIDPANGQTRWEQKVFGPEQTETAIGSPIVYGNMVVGAAGWLTREKRIVALRAPEKDRPAEVAFQFERRMPLCTTPIVVGNLMFLISDEGIGTCVDARTGQVHWQQRIGGTYYASPVSTGTHIYCASTQGDVVVLAATAEFKEVGKSPLGEGTHATPAIARGQMFFRTFSHLMSLGTK